MRARQTTPGQHRPEDRISKRGRNCGRSSRVRVSGCEPENPGANPGGHPITTRAMPQSSRRRIANPLLPGASPGARSISGPSSNSRTTHWHCVNPGPPLCRRAQRAASRAGRSISRSPHRHCGGRRGRTAPAHHFHNARVAQCPEHRASNAEAAGEIPAASTTHFSRRSPMKRQRAQTSSSAGAPTGSTALWCPRQNGPLSRVCGLFVVPPFNNSSHRDFKVFGQSQSVFPSVVGIDILKRDPNLWKKVKSAIRPTSGADLRSSSTAQIFERFCLFECFDVSGSQEIIPIREVDGSKFAANCRVE